jgi:transcriptional regulator
MLEQKLYERNDTDFIRSLIHGRGWAKLVSAVPGSGPVVTHLPVILAPGLGDATVLGHLAREDAELHELGRHESVIVFEGPHGYISPSFYKDGPFVPTWNFVVAHLHGTPEILDAEQAYETLRATVDHFEAQRPEPWSLDTVEQYAQRIAPGVTAFRLSPTRIVGKAKLSQDKPEEIVERVIQALGDDGDVHGNPELADAMRSAARS